MRCFFKYGKLIRQVVLEAKANTVSYNGGRYVFNDKSTFMYEIDPKRNQYSPCCFWTAGNPQAHDFISVNHGIPSGVLEEIVSPELFRLWVRVSNDPLIIAVLAMGIVNFIFMIILLAKFWNV